MSVGDGPGSVAQRRRDEPRDRTFPSGQKPAPTRRWAMARPVYRALRYRGAIGLAEQRVVMGAALSLASNRCWALAQEDLSCVQGTRLGSAPPGVVQLSLSHRTGTEHRAPGITENPCFERLGRSDSFAASWVSGEGAEVTSDNELLVRRRAQNSAVGQRHSRA
jgi:hypothetical protein